MGRDPGDQFPYAAFFWPALAAASAVETASSMAAQLLEFAPATEDARTAQEPEGATPGKIALELDSVRLRDFTTAENGVPTLLCTPLALHGAAVADLAPGHSLVEALRGAGIDRLFMADWRSASADMRSLGIDEYLAALNVLVDRSRRPGRSCRALPGRLAIPDLCGTLPGQGAQARDGRCADRSCCAALRTVRGRRGHAADRVSGPGQFRQRPRDRPQHRKILGKPDRHQTIFMKSCRQLTRSARRNSRGSKPASGSGIPGPSTFPANTISKSSRNCTSATSSPAEVSSHWGKGSTSRGCGFRSICLPGAPTTWSPRSRRLPFNGWWEPRPRRFAIRSRRAIISACSWEDGRSRNIGPRSCAG